MITAAVVAFLGGVVPFQELSWIISPCRLMLGYSLHAVQIDDSNMSLL